jgi:hypothetical protein
MTLRPVIKTPEELAAEAEARELAALGDPPAPRNVIAGNLEEFERLAREFRPLSDENAAIVARYRREVAAGRAPDFGTPEFDAILAAERASEGE